MEILIDSSDDHFFKAAGNSGFFL